MTPEIIHSFVLIFAVCLTFIYPKTSLSGYDLPIAALLFAVLYAAKKLFVKKQEYSRLTESVIFTLITLGIVNSTGGVSSDFFFLAYFLLFSLALILEPVISITTTLTLIIFYLVGLPQGTSLKNLLPIISLAFITPFAMYMGQEHIESQKTKVKTQKVEEDSFLFITLILKNHIKNIREAVENFIGDHQLETIRQSASRMEKLIDKFEKG